MNDADHEQLHRDLGVYVMGALEPAERDRLERHLGACARCREELARLAVLPTLLGRLGDAGTQVPGPAPDPGPAVRRLRQERRRARRRLRALGAVAALAAVLLVVLTGTVLSGRLPAGILDPANGASTFVAADADARARLDPRPWGMAVRITAPDLDDARGYVAWAVTAQGHRAQLASWTSTGAPVEVPGACYLRPADVDRIEIVGASDEQILAVLEDGG